VSVMKVNKVSGVSPSRQVAAVAKRDKQQEEQGEKVSRTDSGRLERVKQAARKAAEQQHTARLQQLEAQIAAGTYKPDPQKIANEILRAAELQAQISIALN
jgi:anti-sigma28 factor (negative regulator of flagellin synthesis)